MTKMHTLTLAFVLVALGLTGQPGVLSAQDADGESVDARLLARYSGMMEQLRTELAAKIPDLADEQRVDAFLASDALDAKLVMHAVLADGSPEGLATFAQQSKDNERLIEQLLADTALMKQMLVADGPRVQREKIGHYGPAMKVYTDIQNASEKAKDGILQRLAVAIALMRQGDPLARYLHFEKAYLDGELDPGFPTLDTWSLRYVVNGHESVEQLTWGRETLRNFRPDHIYTDNRKSRYTRIVNTNVQYGSSRKKFDRPELFGYQNILMNGGICGRRAFFGQFICRAFGVPVIKRPSRAHGALARWTPGGWAVNLGPRWGSGWTDTLYSRDKAFLASTQARRRGDAYLQVARAHWVGFVMGEKRLYGGGGNRESWNRLALLTQQRIIKESKAVTLAPEGEEFGEADDLTIAEKLMASEISDENKQIVYRDDGTIEIPAAAYSTDDGEPGRFALMKSFGGGLQAYLGPFNRKGVNLLRGGSQTSPPENCSSYRRIRSARMGRYLNWGFRVAVSPPAGQKPEPELTLDLGHGVNLELVYIKPGTFVMGGYREKASGNFDCPETPKHKVELTKGYYIGKHEVTASQFDVVGDNPEKVAAMKNPNHPRGVIGIPAAEWFCKQASAKTGHDVRLPTEAEWEYAARAGTDTDWFFGDDPAKLGEYAWYGKNSGKKLQAVGQKKPNPWGLYDIYGNVWERVSDIYDAGYFAQSPRKDPTGPPGREPQSRVRYTVNVPKAGKYAVTARVVTANYDQMLQVVANDDTVGTRMPMPFTCGIWKDSEPVVLPLKQGVNILTFSRTEAPQYGMALKSFTVRPL